MPARNSSMEVSSPAAADAPSTSARRKSGRVTKKPEQFGTTTKRKRNENGGDDMEGDDASDADSSEDEDGEHQRVPGLELGALGAFGDRGSHAVEEAHGVSVLARDAHADVEVGDDEADLVGL